MALRRMLCAALLVCAFAACDDDKPKDKGKPAAAGPTATPDLRAHCEAMAKACGDGDKYIAKLVDECAVTSGAATKCTAEAVAVYDCYEKQLCGKSDKVWTLDDLRKLADRHEACTTERDALRACATQGAK